MFYEYYLVLMTEWQLPLVLVVSVNILIVHSGIKTISKQILSQMLLSSKVKKQTSANASRTFQYTLSIKFYTIYKMEEH